MLRMEIALFLVVAFVAYMYFTAEKEHTALHKTFSVLLVAVWYAIFWKAGKPDRRSLENILFAVFVAVHVLMTLLVSILSGVFGFATSMVLDAYDILAYHGLFLYNVPFILGLWLFSPVGMRSSLFKKW